MWFEGTGVYRIDRTALCAFCAADAGLANHVTDEAFAATCRAPSILKAALDSLNLPGEGETPDQQVTFKYNTCLGACAQAPVMAVDHHLVGKVSTEEAQRRVRELQGDHPKEAQRL